ncbi:MAG TPA: hypothetical protein VFW96_25825 [Thermomicrobiales bacterium]|nr:hypothetical protein [Thermomicrobiales bacterium]
MSIVSRLSTGLPAQAHDQDGPGGHAAPPAGDPRLPLAPDVAPAVLPAAELRPRVDALVAERFTGYLLVERRGSHTSGVVLFHDGRPVQAAAGAARDEAALRVLLAPAARAEIRYAAHPLGDGAVRALTAAAYPPRLTQPMGADVGEVAVLLRDLAGVRHSGVVEIAAARPGAWLRILMYEGQFLGVYSGADRRLQASLAAVAEVLAVGAPELTLFACPDLPAALALPPVAEAPAPAPAVAGGTPARDEALETDLIWFLSRFERVFGRLKERRDPQADVLRALGELTNELAGFVAAVGGGAAQGVVAMELGRAGAAGALGIEFKVGKAGLDSGALAKTYQAYPKRSDAAAEYFWVASNGLLALLDGLLGRMLGAFYDIGTAALAREGCETLLREVRAGLEQITVNS